MDYRIGYLFVIRVVRRRSKLRKLAHAVNSNRKLIYIFIRYPAKFVAFLRSKNPVVICEFANHLSVFRSI